MNPRNVRRSARAAYRLFAETYAPPDPVLEVDSLYLPGHAEIAGFRPLLPDDAYVGTDIRIGLGVDVVADGARLPAADESVGTSSCAKCSNTSPGPGA